MDEATICHHCNHIVYRTKRVAIMVDGILLVSVPICLPCFVNFESECMPLLEKRIGQSV